MAMCWFSTYLRLFRTIRNRIPLNPLEVRYCALCDLSPFTLRDLFDSPAYGLPWQTSCEHLRMSSAVLHSVYRCRLGHRGWIVFFESFRCRCYVYVFWECWREAVANWICFPSRFYRFCFTCFRSSAQGTETLRTVMPTWRLYHYEMTILPLAIASDYKSTVYEHNQPIWLSSDQHCVINLSPFFYLCLYP